MKLPESIYLVRHGDYGVESLNDLGKWQAAEAGRKLKEEGFGESSLVIASTAVRTVETAQVIAEVLNLETEVATSSKLAAMNDLEYLENPIESISQIVEEAELPIREDSKIAVVGHAPMIAKTFPGLGIEGLATGCVHKLEIS